MFASIGKNVLCAIALIVLILPSLSASAFSRRTASSPIAVTFDDLPVATAPGDPLERQQEITRKLVSTLQSRRIPAIGFVNANKLLVNGRLDDSRVALLEKWLDAGFELGNHTFAHQDLHEIGAAAFEEEIARGDAPLRTILERHRKTPRYFRHPFLHTGLSAADRNHVEMFLKNHGYRVAPVTVDNSDWIFARAYENAVGDAALQKRITDDYVPYMLAKVAYFDGASETLFGRRIPQVLLVHASALNADAFGRIATALAAGGHRFISLDRALADSAYESPDNYYGPAGITWIHRWAITRGVPRGFFAGEPRTPEWVLKLAGVESE